MSILSFRYPIDHPDVRQGSILSKETLLDADIVLWNMDNSLSDVNQRNYSREGNQIRGMSPVAHNATLDLLEYRKEGLREFFALGRTLVVEVPINPKLEYNMGITYLFNPLDGHGNPSSFSGLQTLKA